MVDNPGNKVEQKDSLASEVGGLGLVKSRFLLSKSKTLLQYEKVKSISDSVSYSVKTNTEIAKILEDNTDSLFSIHSVNLIDTIRDKSRIWFFAQGWNFKTINYLLSIGVKSFIVDNEQDLKTLNDYLKVYAREMESKKINLLLRMRMKEYTVYTGKHYVFGMYSTQINKWIPILRKNEIIGKLGVHFHRKTQNINEWSLKRDFSESLNPALLGMIDIVNIGGGIPVIYKNYSINLTDRIFNNILEFKEFLNSMKIKMMIEPGRFIAAPPVKLETQIKLVNGNNIIVDASIFNSAMDTFIADIRLLVEGELKKGSVSQMYTIKGSTPDSRDIFRYRVYLKERPKAGDKIIFLNAGAYNFSTDFCSLSKIPTLIIE